MSVGRRRWRGRGREGGKERRAYLSKEKAARMFSLSETQSRSRFTCWVGRWWKLLKLELISSLPPSPLLSFGRPTLLLIHPSLPPFLPTLLCPSRLQQGSFRL